MLNPKGGHEGCEQIRLELRPLIRGYSVGDSKSCYQLRNKYRGDGVGGTVADGPPREAVHTSQKKSLTVRQWKGPNQIDVYMAEPVFGRRERRYGVFMNLNALTLPTRFGPNPNLPVHPRPTESHRD